MNKIKSKRMQRILFTIIIIVIISLSFYFLSETITKYAGFLVFEEVREESLIDCITGKNIFLFIDADDSTEAIVSVGLDEYVDAIAIFNCRRNSDMCSSIGITNFPTWVIEGRGMQGSITEKDFITFVGC